MCEKLDPKVEKAIYILLYLKSVYVENHKWYLRKEALAATAAYFQLLFYISHKISSQYYAVVNCPFCGLQFITSPANRNRKDIFCPFGCRELNHRNKLNMRCKKYRKTPKGKKAKQELNKKRQLKISADSSILNSNQLMCGPSEAFLKYIRFITGLLNRRIVSWEETEKILLRFLNTWRQRPLDYYLK